LASLHPVMPTAFRYILWLEARVAELEALSEKPRYGTTSKEALDLLREIKEDVRRGEEILRLSPLGEVRNASNSSDHKTVEQLAAEQGVGPIEDPSALQDDLFDDGAFDGFEKMIDELRHNQKGDLL